MTESPLRTVSGRQRALEPHSRASPAHDWASHSIVEPKRVVISPKDPRHRVGDYFFTLVASGEVRGDAPDSAIMNGHSHIP
jgi:hypothetical protein